MSEELSTWERMAVRLVELVTDDPELHDAVVHAIEASAQHQEARAEHSLALAERKRLENEKLRTAPNP